ncbi:Cullin-associated NEDD8-dissociated protein 1 [Datura stramonium]|uniref:Cullin-associated NEDD8-dissociated protein 1 n=1 Tax=Datura stramonium TaxID=4076 RepID=A0ABS8UZ92_DATST|nr:Cullin-associated NEDD8-dissociated protein 1 [Datura stramonium]
MLSCIGSYRPEMPFCQHEQACPKLIDRFKEREENVKMAIIEAEVPKIVRSCQQAASSSLSRQRLLLVLLYLLLVSGITKLLQMAIFAELVRVLRPKIKEVKECAITCMGLVVSTFGDHLHAELSACLPVLVDRMGNEITRTDSC